MIVEIGKWIVIVFGIFFIFIGILMFSKPRLVREILRKAGSTNLINYGEITIRMIPAIGFILVADYARFPQAFKIIGWFMLGTSFILFFVPKKLHHNFSNKAADILKPIYFQFISPITLLMGIMLIYSVC